MNRETVKRMEAARDAALTTPKSVIKAFSAGPVKLGPITLQPFGLGQLWLLQAIDSPFVREKTEDAPQGFRVQIADVCKALYILSKPTEAWAAHEEDPESHSVLNARAFEMAVSISGDNLSELIQGIQTAIKAGSDTPSVEAVKKKGKK